METVTERILALWRTQPDRRFCTFADGAEPLTVTYDRLVRHATSFAQHYRAAGIGSGDIVPLVLHHTPEAAPAFLGALLIGAIPSYLAPLTIKQDPQIYWRSMAHLCGRIGGRLLVTESGHRAQMCSALPDLNMVVLTIEEVPFDPKTPVPAPISGDIAFLQHSSGTTAIKKGVALSHRAVIDQIDSYARTLGVNDRDVIATWLPLYHDMGLIACLMLAMLKGIPMVALAPLTWVTRPTLLLDAIERYGCTLLWQPNFAFHHLAGAMTGQQRWDLSSLRAVINAGEPCKPDTFALFASTCAAHGLRPNTLQVLYGLAENVFAVTQTRPGEAVAVDRVDRAAFSDRGHARPAPTASAGDTLSFLSCGRPIPGVDLRIVGADGQPLPDRQVGEIHIAGRHLFDGYFRQPEETARRLRAGWYHTGDLGYRVADELYVTGRRDDLLTVYGRNYYAHEIEYLVSRIPGVCPGRTVALGLFDPELGSQEVVVIAESDAPESRSNRAFASLIRSRVLAETGLMVRAVRIVPPGWLVKTSSGKISRTDNLGRYLALCHDETTTGTS